MSSRREFLKDTLKILGAGAGITAITLSDISFDKLKDIEIASPNDIDINEAEAYAGCSYGSNCGGGGGSCSYGSSCSGDGGGGGGMCSYGSSCGGGGGMCSYGSDCAGS